MWYLLEESQGYTELEAFAEFIRQRVMPAFTQNTEYMRWLPDESNDSGSGTGNRMRPLTLTTPKPLLEVGGSHL